MAVSKRGNHERRIKELETKNQKLEEDMQRAYMAMGMLVDSDKTLKELIDNVHQRVGFITKAIEEA